MPRRFPLVLLLLLALLGFGGAGLTATAEPPPAPAEPAPADKPAKGVSAFEYFFEKKQPQPAATPPAPPAPAAPAPSAPPAITPPIPIPEVEMSTYYLVLLRRGPAWTAEETPAVKKLQEGHMANIRRLAQEGKLVIAGPFLEQTGAGSLAGLFIFRAGSREEVQALTATDPAIQAGRLVPEILPWLGPKTLHY
jgi:uncharacterized protein YciI